MLAKTLTIVLCIVTSALSAQTRLSLTEDWQFVRGYQYNMQKQPPWEQVDLPHTWNAQDVADGKLDYYRGLGVYKKKIAIEAGHLEKRFFLHFEGSTLVTDVYVNGRHAGHHKGGYTGFTLEITDFVKIGEDNELMVMVNNTFDSEVMPLVGDFNVYGGLHRPVHLLLREKACIDVLDHGSPGVFITQENVSPGKADVSVSGKISNGAGREKTLGVSVEIKDRQGLVVAVAKANIDVGPKETKGWSVDLSLEEPRLWHGRKDPYLYQVVTTVTEEEKMIDRLEQPLGLRYFSLDPAKGFFLNGEYTDLRGVCYHEAKAGKGSALTPSDYDQDFEIMLEMGVNAIRTAHYPHSEYFYRVCDSLGILVYTEIPMVGPGGYLGRGFMNSAGFKANGKEQLKALIRQNYNHPSIFFWGLYNEVKINGDDPYEYIQELNEIAKKEDPYRLTMAATFQDNHNNDITDAIGWNRYFGWYGGDPSYIGQWADEMHDRFPGRPISVSEYGAGASIHHHSDSLVAPKAAGRWHPEEWQAHYHEQNWQELEKRPFIWGKFIWLMFDFGAVHRAEGDRKGVNDKGLVTADRLVKKDAYYFYKAHWNPRPMLYLASKRYTERTRDKTTIKVYTNLGKVDFYLRGKRVGSAKPVNGIAISPVVTLVPGENKIIVKGKSKGITLEDQCSWTLTP